MNITQAVQSARIYWHQYLRSHHPAAYAQAIRYLKEARRLKGDIITTPTLAGRFAKH